MTSSLTYIIPLAAIILLLAGIAYTGKYIPEQFATAPNLTLPSVSEVEGVVDNTGNITPVYENRFIKNVTGWRIVFNKNDLTGQGTVKTADDLVRLNKNIASARNWTGTAILKSHGYKLVMDPFTNGVSANLRNATVSGNIQFEPAQLAGNIATAENWTAVFERQGCHDVVINPFTMEMAAKLANSTVQGKIGNNDFTIYGNITYVPEEDGYIDLDQWHGWETYKKVSPTIEILSRASNNFLKGDQWMFMLKATVPANNVSIGSVEDLNKFLKQRKVDTLTF